METGAPVSIEIALLLELDAEERVDGGADQPRRVPVGATAGKRFVGPGVDRA